MFGKAGRPRLEMRDYDEALSPMGGLRAVVFGMIRARRTSREVSEKLAQMTGLRPVNPRTIVNWVREWEVEGERKVQATR